MHDLEFSPLLLTNVKGKFAKWNFIYDFLFDDNSNVCAVRYHFQDILNRIVHDLGIDIEKLSRSNVNMTSDMSYVSSYVCSICVFLCVFYGR